MRLFFLFLLFSGISFSQQQRIDSLTNLITHTKVSQEKIPIYIALHEATGALHQESGAHYLEKAQALITENTVDSLQQQVFNRYADFYLQKHQYDSTLYYAEKALQFEQKLPTKELITTYSILGTTRYYISSFEEAITFHLKALRVCDAIACAPFQRAFIYNNMSVAYIAMANWEKSEDYLKKALIITDADKDHAEYIRAKSNLAIIYAMQGKFEESATIFKEEIAHSRQINNKLRESKNYNNLGVLYERQGIIEASLENYEKALQLAKEVDDKASIALGYQNVANVQRKLGNYNEAIRNFEIGLKMTKELGNRDKLRDGMYAISELYEEKGDYKRAVEHYKRFFDLHDSIASEKLLNSVQELEIKYETEKKEKNILALSEQKLRDEAALNKQQLIIKRLLFGFLTVALLIGLSFIIYKQYISNQKKQELIHVINATQTEERKRIAQDLHDSVGGSLALLKNKIQQIVSPETEGFEDMVNTISSTSDQVRHISHNLMPGELVRFGLTPAIRTLLEQINKETLQAQLYTSDETSRFEPSVEVQLYRIIQEAIQNVLKHSKARNLYIHLNKHKQYLNVLIEDDGIGMQPSGTPGMGITNIKQRVHILNGTCTIDSAPQKGTTLNIQIPL